MQTADFEFPLFTKDGEVLDILLNTTPRRDETGDIVGVVSVGQDITAKKVHTTKPCPSLASYPGPCRPDPMSVFAFEGCPGG